jgi:hypothetical protein
LRLARAARQLAQVVDEWLGGSGWLAVLVLVLTFACACEDGRPVTCRFGVERPLFRSEGAGFDALSLSAVAAGSVAVFSEASGLFAQKLDEQGRPRATPLRLSARCDGGVDVVDVVAQRESLIVACLRPSAAGDAAAAGVTIYTLDEALRVVREQSFGVARRLSAGIALASDARGVYCAWQDAAVGEARVWFAPIAAGAAGARVVSDATQRAGAVSLSVHHGSILATWAEQPAQTLSAGGRIVIANLSRGTTPTPVTTTRDALPSPSLVSVGEHLVLAFRDRRNRGRKTGLYMLQLDEQQRPVGRPVRVARADGVAQPAVRACAGSVIAATPRTFAGDYFVGVVQVAARLDRMSGEQQFYEDSHEFAQAAVACASGGATLLIGERGQLGRPGAALRAVPLACR